MRRFIFTRHITWVCLLAFLLEGVPCRAGQFAQALAPTSQIISPKAQDEWTRKEISSFIEREVAKGIPVPVIRNGLAANFQGVRWLKIDKVGPQTPVIVFEIRGNPHAYRIESEGRVVAADDELIPVVDRMTRQPIGLKLREDVHRDGDWHEGIQAYLLRRGPAGRVQVLLQKKSYRGGLAKGKWDPTTTTQMLAGNGQDLHSALLRCLHDQLGIAGNRLRIARIGDEGWLRISQKLEEDPSIFNREFLTLYLVQVPDDIEIHCAHPDVERSEWVDWEEFVRRVQAHPSDFTKTARSHVLNEPLLMQTQRDIQAFLEGRPIEPFPFKRCLYFSYAGPFDIAVNVDQRNRISLDIFEPGRGSRPLHHFDNIKASEVDDRKEPESLDAAFVTETGSGLQWRKGQMEPLERKPDGKTILMLRGILNKWEAEAQQIKSGLPADRKAVLDNLAMKITSKLNTLLMRAYLGDIVLLSDPPVQLKSGPLGEGAPDEIVLVTAPGTFDPPHLDHIDLLLDGLLQASNAHAGKRVGYVGFLCPVGDKMPGLNGQVTWKAKKIPAVDRHLMSTHLTRIFSPLMNTSLLSLEYPESQGAENALRLAFLYQQRMDPEAPNARRPVGLNFYWVIGSDNFNRWGDTYKADAAEYQTKLSESSRIGLIVRDSPESPIDEEAVRRWAEAHLNIAVLTNLYLAEIRSSTIRGEQGFDLLTTEVAAWARDHHLYGLGEGAPYTFDDFTGELRTIIEELASGYFYPSEREGLLEEAVMEFVGYGVPTELLEPYLSRRKRLANEYLRRIYGDARARADFLRFFKNYRRRIVADRNKNTPAFIAAVNYLLGKSLDDTEFVRSNAELFQENITVREHPWYGKGPVTQVPLPGHTKETLQFAPPAGRTIRIRLVGVGERSGRGQKTAYLRALLSRLPPHLYDRIEIVADDIFFQDTVYPFNPAGQYVGPQAAFLFDATGTYRDPVTCVVFKKLNLSDSHQSYVSPDFSPPADDVYDVVINSRVTVDYIGNPEQRLLLLRNSQKLLKPGGLLLFDVVESSHLTLYGREDTQPRGLVPYRDVEAVRRKMKIVLDNLHGALPAQRDMVLWAYQMAMRFATLSNPEQRKLVLARLLAATQKDPIAVTAVFLTGIDDELLRNHVPADGQTLQKILDVKHRLESTLVEHPQLDEILLSNVSLFHRDQTVLPVYVVAERLTPLYRAEGLLVELGYFQDFPILRISLGRPGAQEIVHVVRSEQTADFLYALYRSRYKTREDRSLAKTGPMTEKDLQSNLNRRELDLSTVVDAPRSIGEPLIALSQRIVQEAGIAVQDVNMSPPDGLHTTVDEIMHESGDSQKKKFTQEEILSVAQVAHEIVSRYPRFNVRIKGLAMMPNGSVIAKGYVDNEVMDVIRAETRKRFGIMLAYPDDLVHFVLFRPQVILNEHTLARLRDAVIAYAQDDLGTFEVDALQLAYSEDRICSARKTQLALPLAGPNGASPWDANAVRRVTDIVAAWPNRVANQEDVVLATMVPLENLRTVYHGEGRTIERGMFGEIPVFRVRTGRGQDEKAFHVVKRQHIAAVMRKLYDDRYKVREAKAHARTSPITEEDAKKIRDVLFPSTEVVIGVPESIGHTLESLAGALVAQAGVPREDILIRGKEVIHHTIQTLVVQPTTGPQPGFSEEEVLRMADVVAEVVARYPAIRIEVRGLAMMPNGNVIAKGYVDNEVMDAIRTELRTRFKHRIPFPDDLVHFTILQPQQPMSEERLSHLRALVEAHGQDDFGEFTAKDLDLRFTQNFVATDIRASLPIACADVGFQHYLADITKKIEASRERYAGFGEARRWRTELILDFAGVGAPDELNEETFAQRDRRAALILQWIYRDPRARVSFEGHIARFRKNVITDVNRNAVPFMAAVNWLSGRRLDDRTFIQEHPEIFRGNRNLENHPWYGQDAIVNLPLLAAQAESLKIPAPDPAKDKIRILIIGVGERWGGRRKTAILREMLDQLPKGRYRQIEIVATDAFFQEQVFPFDPKTGRYLGRQDAFLFDANGRYVDPQTGVIFVKADLNDPAQDISSDNFDPKRLGGFDLVLNSRLAVEYVHSEERLRNILNNSRSLLSPGGILLYDTSDCDRLDVYVHTPEAAQGPRAFIPYRDFGLMQYDAKCSAKQVKGGVEAWEGAMLKAALLSQRYLNQPMGFFAPFTTGIVVAKVTKDPLRVLAHLTTGVPAAAIEHTFEPGLAGQILAARRNQKGQSHVAPDAARWFRAYLPEFYFPTEEIFGMEEFWQLRHPVYRDATININVGMLDNVKAIQMVWRKPDGNVQTSYLVNQAAARNLHLSLLFRTFPDRTAGEFWKAGLDDIQQDLRRSNSDTIRIERILQEFDPARLDARKRIVTTQGYSACTFLDPENEAQRPLIEILSKKQHEIVQQFGSDKIVLVPSGLDPVSGKVVARQGSLHITLAGLRHNTPVPVSREQLIDTARQLRSVLGAQKTIRGKLIGPFWHKTLAIVMVWQSEIADDPLVESKREVAAKLGKKLGTWPFHLTLAYHNQGEFTPKQFNGEYAKMENIPIVEIPVEISQFEVNGYGDIAFIDVTRDPGAVIHLGGSEQMHNALPEKSRQPVQTTESRRLEDNWEALGALDKLLAEAPGTVVGLESGSSLRLEEARRMVQEALIENDPEGPVYKLVQDGQGQWFLRAVLTAGAVGSVREPKTQAMIPIVDGVMDRLREIYNARVTDEYKEFAREKLQKPVRTYVGQNEYRLTEMEADLAVFGAGHISWEEFITLSILRNRMKQVPEFRQLEGRRHNPIPIYFIPTGSATELFWHEETFAPGFGDPRDFAVYVSLPLVMRDVRVLTQDLLFAQRLSRLGEKASTKGLTSVDVSKHYARHLAGGPRDKGLDNEIRAMALRDKQRKASGELSTEEFQTPQGYRVVIAPVEAPDKGLETLKDLHNQIQAKGWKAVAVPVEQLPQELKFLFSAVHLDMHGVRLSFMEILKLVADEVVFTPHVMVYAPEGYKMVYTVHNITLVGHEPQGQLWRPGKRILIVSSLAVSDALRTGQRIELEPMQSLAREIIGDATEKLFEQIPTEEIYRPRITNALRRHLFLSAVMFGSQTGESMDILNKAVQDRTSEILKQNADLGLEPSNTDVPRQIVQAIGEMARRMHPSPVRPQQDTTALIDAAA